MKKATAVLAVVIMFVAAISGMILYYNNLLAEKNADISQLEAQITNQSSHIDVLESQIASLENLTYPSARIDSVIEDAGWSTTGGSAGFRFRLNVTNTGLVTVNNVTVTVQNLPATNFLRGQYSDRVTISIYPNEQTEVACIVWMSMLDHKAAMGLDYLISISYNGTVLDEQTVLSSQLSEPGHLMV